jgi:hypothetical protein
MMIIEVNLRIIGYYLKMKIIFNYTIKKSRAGIARPQVNQYAGEDQGFGVAVLVLGTGRVGYVVPWVALGTGVAMLTGTLITSPALISLALVILFNSMIFATVLLNLMAMAARVSPEAMV